MKKEWKIYAKRADFKALAEKYNIDQVTARVLVNRGVAEDEMDSYLNPNLECLHSPHLMKDMDLAVDLLVEAISQNIKIRVIGDYDIDGVTSSYLLVTAISRAGGQVDYAIPHRIEDGYGMNVSMVEKAKDDGVDFIITCDNGISAFDAIEKAKDYGMTVVVTDHHQILDDNLLPRADAVVNPHRIDCSYPMKEICGGEIAWKLMLALYEKCRIPLSEAYDQIDIAAFATVGDIMPLQGENRTIVSLGLKKMQNSNNLGLNALIEVTGIDKKSISAYHLGFVLGPCINASGRLDSAKQAVDLLLSKNQAESLELASELMRLNEERKAMTVEGQEAALEVIEKEHLENDAVLVIYMPKLHESLCGIVAGRIKEQFFRPTFVLSDGESCVKGSGRSIPAYNMFGKLQDAEDLLLKYGGHPMAAGISLEAEKVDEFRHRLNAMAGLTNEELIKKTMIDVKMPLSYISEDLVLDLEKLEPFGNANEKPIFAEADIKIRSVSYIGKSKNYLKFRLDKGNGQLMDALYFGDAKEMKQAIDAKNYEGAFDDINLGKANQITMSFLYYPSINEYNGRKNLQVVIQDYLCN